MPSVQIEIWSSTNHRSRLNSPLGHTSAEANTCGHFPSTSPWPTCISVVFCFPAGQTLQPSFCSYDMAPSRPRLDPWECGEWQSPIRCRRTCRCWSTCAPQPVRFAEHFVISCLSWRHIFQILQTPPVLGTPRHNWPSRPPRRFHCPAFFLRRHTPGIASSDSRTFRSSPMQQWKTTSTPHCLQVTLQYPVKGADPMSCPWCRWYDVTPEQCGEKTLLGCPTATFFVQPILVQPPSVPFQPPWHILLQNAKNTAIYAFPKKSEIVTWMKPCK